MAPSCKLELAGFSAQLKIQDGDECGNKVKSKKISLVRLVLMETFLGLALDSGQDLEFFRFVSGCLEIF